MSTTPETRIKRHPLLGAFNGALVGVAIGMYLVLFSVVPLAVAELAPVVGIAAGLGLAWGTLAPARAITEAPPSTTSFGTVFTRSDDERADTALTYEQVFGAPAPRHSDDSEPAPVGSGFFST